MAKSRGRKFAEITSPASGVFDITSVPTITNAKLQNSAMTLAGSSVSLGGTGVADTDALSEGSSNVYFTDARVQTFLGGGTLAGNIVVPDNRSIYVGSQSDFRIIHNTINTQLTNTTGALQITSSGALALSGSAVAVTGAATFNVGATFGGDVAIGPDALSGDLLSVGSTSTSQDVVTIYSNAATSGTSLKVYQDSPSSTGEAVYIQNDGSGNSLRIREDAADVFVVRAGGNVGIGATTPGLSLIHI